jgi:hypothetical protein
MEELEREKKLRRDNKCLVKAKTKLVSLAKMVVEKRNSGESKK